MIRRMLLKYLLRIINIVQLMFARRRSRYFLCLFLILFSAGIVIVICGALLEFFLSKPMQDFSYPLDIDLYNLIDLLERRDPKVAKFKEINPLPYRYLHSQSALCATHNVKLLILVKSTHRAWKNRESIRKTWAQTDCMKRDIITARTLFMLGKHQTRPQEDITLRRENAIYGDILQMDFEDSYFNNTYKMMMGLHYAINYCPTADFITFVDDDYFVNPWRLKDLVASIHPRQYPNYAAGYVYYSPIPKRSWDSKWFISHAEYAFKEFPDYPAAGTVVLSMPMARTLYHCMRYVQFSRFDDVFLGLMLFKLHIAPVHVKEIHAYRPDVISDFVISSHGFRDPDDLMDTWSNTGLQDKCHRSKIK